MKKISRRTLAKLEELQDSLQEIASLRRTAVHLLLVSKDHATRVAQRDFWLEFSWIHQEYLIALSRLAEFCVGRNAQLPTRPSAEPSGIQLGASESADDPPSV